MDEKGYGQIAYEAYGDYVGWRNHVGNPMPEWISLPQLIRTAWIVAADAVRKED